jgi:4-amino-4-deoxy-L-arabinose transferase-like glycosyltransferase
MTSAALIAILALTFYLRLLFFGQIIDADVGRVGYVGWRMAEGEILMDIEGPGKPPLSDMLYAVFVHIFGTSVIGLKMLGAIFVLLAVLAIYGLVNQIYGKQVGLLAALLFGIFSSGPIIEGGTVNLETMLHFPYILTISFFIKASTSGRLRWYFLAGMCAALATLVKQVGGVLFFVFLSYGIHEWWRKKDLISIKGRLYPVRKLSHLWRGWRKKSSFFIEGEVQSPAFSNGVYRYLLLGIGALLPLIGVISFYHFHGYTLSQIYDSMLGSNLRYVQRGHEYPKLIQLFYLNMKDILLENGILWVGTMFGVAYLGRQVWRGKGQTGDRILLWWVFWSFAVLWTSGTFFWHYFLQIVAPFSVLAAYGIVTSWNMLRSLSPLPKFVAKMGWTALLITMVIIFIKTDYKYYFSYTPVEQTVLQHEISKGIYDTYGLYNLAMGEISSYIRSHTDPNETIYVWGIAPQVYFLAQRRAATRYWTHFNMSTLVTNNALKALKGYTPVLMEDLRRSAPAYIVQIFRLEDFPELQAFVRDRYVRDGDAEFFAPPYTVHLYRRNP